MTRSLASLALVSFVLVACSSSSPSDDVPAPDAGGDTIDKADCAAFAQSFVDAAQTCGSPLPANAKSTIDGWCRKGVDVAAMCGGDPAAGLACFSSPDPSDWVCSGGEPLPACGGDVAAGLGAYCLLALGNPSCTSGLQCTYDVDCPTGSACNGATGQCFSKTAYCVGLPCNYDVDCPGDTKCNNAEGVCVGR